MFKTFKKALLVSFISVSVLTLSNTDISANKSYRDASLSGTEQHPLDFKNSKQLILKSQDSKKRATDAHIQLSYSEKPVEKRASRLEFNPVGWHNYRFKYEKSNGKISKEWLFNRGHLVGYQFSGLNDEGRNLVPETAYLNTGALKSMNSSNKQSMLYYENHLANWLKNNKSYRLDYQVTPLYKKDELLPRQVRLSYVGYDSRGKLIKIKFNSYREENGNNNATVVYLNNESPNAIINYSDGTARNTLDKSKTIKNKQEVADSASSEAVSKAKSEAKVSSKKIAKEARESSARESSARESSARESSARESSARESSIAELHAKESANATRQESQSVVSASQTADGNVNNTSAYKWAVQDGFTWATRKGHCTRIAPGGTLPAGYHWEAQ